MGARGSSEMSDDYEVFETDVAIVGMALRVPGASDKERFWENLRDGVESIRTYTDEELLAAGERPELLRDPRYVRAGAPLDAMEMFDGELFGIGPKESAIMDPQHRHFLECCWEALESAGHPPEKLGGPVGVFAGCGMGSYFYFNLCSNLELVRDVGLFLLRHTGNDKDFLATRVSYLLDLRGPAVGVQTACSTSLVAVHLAIKSLLSREVDLALAGGVTIELPHRRGYLYQDGEILSPDGHCHAFDHRAKGTVFGSGAGVVALRRLEDALDDRDVIHAVIRGSAVNNDGRGKVSYLAPSVDGQAACMVEAYRAAGVDPRTIEYVECHGTGTYLGDPIEIEALTQAFRTQTDDRGFCRVGSVKANIGHLDTAAGVASLVKAALALEHAEIPPTPSFERPNPTIDFEPTPFRVADRRTPWPAPSGHPRRAAVNSLGVGGTNAHVVLQEPPARAEGGAARRPFQLLALSAKSAASLDAASARLAAHLRAHPELSLADVAWTLRHGRSELEQRRVLAAASLEEAAELLERADPRRVHTHLAKEARSVAFLLPGGGAQYAGMGAALREREPVFREHLDRGLELLRSRHGIDLAPMLFASGAELEGARAALDRMSHQLPATFLVSCAMARLLESYGVVPEALLGHSLGENTAACLSGVMRFEDCLGLVVLRGQLFERTAPGAMLSVPLSPERLTPLLEPGLDVAVINAPDATVVSGAPDAIDRLAARLTAEGEVEARRLPIPTAAHSHLLEPILGEFRAYLRSIPLSPPAVPFVSNLTGAWITGEQATDPEYWVSHLRRTVRFADGVGTLIDRSSRVLLECGPGQALTALARQHPRFRGGAHDALPSMRHKDDAVDDAAFFTACLGRVWAAGGGFDWSALWRGEERVRVELPTYAWRHAPYFVAPGEARREDDDDLPKIADLERWGWRPRWRPALADPRPAERHTWLLFLDGSGVGRRLCERLAARGDRVVRVHAGDAYYKHGEHEYSLSPERGKEGYAALVADLVAAGRAPDRIVHLWLLEAEERVRPGSSLYHHHQERGFFSLFFLAQALADESVTTPLHLTVITNGMQSVAGEPLPFPDKATVLGPARVIPRELAGVTANVIDVSVPERGAALLAGGLGAALLDPFRGRRHAEAELDALAERLLDEVCSPPSSSAIALRGPRRYEEVFEPCPLAALEGIPGALREEGVYLITGGLGGLGLTIAEHLARTCRARLVLIGRSPFPPRDQWRAWIRQHGDADRTARRITRVLEIERGGSEVLVAAADVTNLEEMRSLVVRARGRFGAIHGVFHTAGVIDDDLIVQKTQSSVTDVLTPKIQGTMVLERLFASAPLELLVLFSSTSTITAPAGQVDYVAANAFLDAFAASRAGGPTRVVAIDWGLWRGVGMAEEAVRGSSAARAGEPAGEQPLHPLLEARVRDGRGGTVLTAKLSPERHWVLGGHRTRAGHPLLVGTAYLELARAALEAYGERGPFEIEDLFFLRPLTVDDGEEREVRVRLRPTERGYAFETRSAVETDGKRGFGLHAQAHVVIRALDRPPPLDVAAIEARCSHREEDPSGIPTPQEAHLALDPRWRVLRRAARGAREAIGQLALSPAFAHEAAELGLHPALLDIATGWAMELIEGYHADALWVPVAYERVRVHAPLGARVVSWVRSHPGNRDDGEFVYFDVTVASEAGEVLLEVERLSLRKMTGEVDVTRRERAPGEDLELDPSSGGREPSPAERQLAKNLERGIAAEEGTEALLRALAVPDAARLVVSSLDLHGLLAQAERGVAARAADAGIRLARPDVGSEYAAPKNEIERTLVGFWQELLGLEQVGVADSFFDLGGHSLIAVRLFAKVKRAFKVELPISVLFEAPTIERCAALIEAAIGATQERAAAAPRARYTHLVAMHPGEGGPKTPFFLVAGMFGNVLNLRHLAHLLGTERRFFGLQARGLYGDHTPHETFEEMAEAYLEELRTVQARGPYLLGGFSGGGITAYEMARRLTARGEEVALLVMLDTPLPFPPPRLTLRDRALIQSQRLRAGGPAYLAEWALSRGRWELERLRRRVQDPKPERAPDTFHAEAIEQAFRRALARYVLVPWPGRLTLFRPPLEIAYDLGGGRLLDADREYVFEDNGWTPYVRQMDVYEVPGDHDSMVLEPNVRVLARKLREVVEDAEARARRGAVVSSSAAE